MVPVLLYLQLSRGSLNNSNLLVSTIENSPPWNLNGVGICIDLLHRVQQLAQEDDIYFDYQLRPWAGTYSAAVQDVINISTNTALLAADISITAPRISSGAVYSMPFNDDGVLIVKSALKPQTGYTTLEQIHDATKQGAGTWRVCIQGGTAQAEQFPAKYPGVIWKFVVHPPGAYEALKNNECEMAVLPNVQTNYDLATVEKSGELATYGAQPLTLGLAWTASNPSIANFVSQYLATLQSSGELDIIKAKYFDTRSLDSNTADKPLLGQHYYVVVLPDEPYIQLDKTGLVWPKKVGYVQPQPANLTSRFSGFIIDVLEDLSVNLGFQYTLMLPSNAYDGYDGSYGQTVRDVESLGAKGNFYAGPLFITPARITNLYLTSPVPSIFLSFFWSHAVK
jgi:ABC-type amino acid transport substrate-binding protein